MKLYTPVKPGSINQSFGSNPDYYAKFHDSFGNPLKGHDGIDFFATHGTPVYAAHDGMCRFTKDSHGGEGMFIRSLENENDTFARSMYWHLIGDTDPQYPSPIPTDGVEYPVKTGTLIGYADNTGAPYESTGTHLHFGLFFTNSLGVIQNQSNGFDGRVDPMSYFSDVFAQDVPQLIQKESLLVSLLKRLVELLQNK